MGHRIMQRILECAICNKAPDHGEPLWEMCGQYWCEECCNVDYEGVCIECNKPMMKDDEEFVSAAGDVTCSEDCKTESNFDYLRDCPPTEGAAE